MSDKPAFPCTHDNQPPGMDPFGMTLREYAAIKVMQGILSNSTGMKWRGKSMKTCEDFASASVGMADALIAELVKETK